MGMRRKRRQLYQIFGVFTLSLIVCLLIHHGFIKDNEAENASNSGNYLNSYSNYIDGAASEKQLEKKVNKLEGSSEFYPPKKIEEQKPQQNYLDATYYFRLLDNIKIQARSFYGQLFESDLTGFRSWAIQKEREFLNEEMKGYRFPQGETLEELVPEQGGTPIRNLIFTTWRSGSTFMGEILTANPGTFYFYEPLLSYNITQIRRGKVADEAIELLKNLLNCNYTMKYLEFGREKKNWHFFNHNLRVSKYCEFNNDVCKDDKFMSSMCRLFPFQSLKTVRLRLSLAKTFLDDPSSNVRILYLVRDPRGTMQSRRHRVWCPGNPDCDNPKNLCTDLENDYQTAEKFRQLYPDKFLYEDMALNIYSAVKKVLKFMRLDYHPQIEAYLRNHTTEDGERLSTFKATKSAPFHWRLDYENDFNTVQMIQENCQNALDLWGYRKAFNATHMLTLNPLKPPPWPEMGIY